MKPTIKRLSFCLILTTLAAVALDMPLATRADIRKSAGSPANHRADLQTNCTIMISRETHLKTAVLEPDSDNIGRSGSGHAASHSSRHMQISRLPAKPPSGSANKLHHHDLP